MRTLLAPLCFVLLMVVAVAGHATDGNDAPEKAAPPASDTAADVTPNTWVMVETLSAGEEPRTALRYRFEEGDGPSFTLTVRQASHQEVMGFSTPQTHLPVARVSFDSRIESINENGLARLAVAVREVEVIEEPNTQSGLVPVFRRELAQLSGRTWHFHMDDRGHVERTETDAPRSRNANVVEVIEAVQQSLQQVMLALPGEDVGAGARWRVTSPAEYTGIEAEQIATVRLDSIDEDGFTVNLTIEQSAMPQEVDHPAAPAGMRMELRDFSSRGTGEYRLGFASPLPTRASIEMKWDTVFEMETRIGEQRMRTETTRKVEVAHADPEPDDPDDGEDAEQEKDETE